MMEAALNRGLAAGALALACIVGVVSPALATSSLAALRLDPTPAGGSTLTIQFQAGAR